MGRNYLSGTHGDAANAVLAAAGYNFRRLLEWLALLCRLSWQPSPLRPIRNRLSLTPDGVLHSRRPTAKERRPGGADRLRSRTVTASRPSGAIVPMENTVLGGVSLDRRAQSAIAALQLDSRCTTKSSPPSGADTS
jgi:hypothetical protein